MTPVYKYTVCWRDQYCRQHEWKHATFANKKEAQQFAKSRKTKIRPKPYILQTITDISFFEDNSNIEYIKNRNVIYRLYEKQIRY